MTTSPSVYIEGVAGSEIIEIKKAFSINCIQDDWDDTSQNVSKIKNWEITFNVCGGNVCVCQADFWTWIISFDEILRRECCKSFSI